MVGQGSTRVERRVHSAPTPVSSGDGEVATTPDTLPITRHTFSFHGYRCSYLVCLPDSPPHAPTSSSPPPTPVVCVHGFGAGAFHWKKNLPALAAAGHAAYALDLLGFGDSDMPQPGALAPDGRFRVAYTFEVWGAQIRRFVERVVMPVAGVSQVALVANSIGCLAALQAAHSERVERKPAAPVIAAVTCINPSLRMLHVKKRSWLNGIVAPAMIRLLAYRPFATRFFALLRRPRVLRRILCTAYAVASRDGDAAAAAVVTEQLVEEVRRPALRPGALDVFLAFTAYDHGPLAEELIAEMAANTATAPPPRVCILWSERDPWERFHLGHATFATLPGVSRFVRLPGLGHCPQDQAPEVVNPLLLELLRELPAPPPSPPPPSSA